MTLNNQEKYKKLRSQYKVFSYNSFSVEKNDKDYVLVYEFDIDKKYFFKPKHIISLNDNLATENLSEEFISCLAFHIGMVELISYWKSACPPTVLIKPFALSESAMQWWKKLYYQGLGEFFHINGIDADFHDFMEIIPDSSDNTAKFDFQSINNKCIVAVGGGKDSAVSIELLKYSRDVFPLVVNPRKASLDTIKNAGISINKSLMVKRSIDKTLLKMNDAGFLNGHTPFSALLAFESLLIAYLSGIRDIALSNESGANEATVPGTKVNHQYSKSLEFEADFKQYVSENISNSFNYFSFLRPLDEIHIALLFSQMKNHHKSFRSCNVGSKTDSWCGLCPKCLFTWIILSPFIDVDELVDAFGKNLWEESELISDLEKLCGLQVEKPFECVGTRKEVVLALDTMVRRNRGRELPPLLMHYNHRRHDIPNYSENLMDTLSVVSGNHFLENEFLSLINSNLSKAIDTFNKRNYSEYAKGD